MLDDAGEGTFDCRHELLVKSGALTLVPSSSVQQFVLGLLVADLARRWPAPPSGLLLCPFASGVTRAIASFTGMLGHAT